jgi:hypothetical protein
LKAIKQGGWEERGEEGLVTEGVEWIKVKYNYSRDTPRNPFEH